MVLYCGPPLAVRGGKEATSNAHPEEGKREDPQAQKAQGGIAKEATVRRAVCPVCGASFMIDAEDAVYGNRVTCPECGALLEVLEEEPLVLEEVIGEDRDL